MEFIRPVQRTGLEDLIAQLQASQSAPFARAIEGLGQNAASVFDARRTASMGREKQADDIMTLLAQHGMLAPTTGTVQNGQRVMDAPEPGTMDLSAMYPNLPIPKGARYKAPKPKGDATENDMMTVTDAALKNFPALAKAGLKAGERVPSAFMIAHTKPDTKADPNKKAPAGFRFTENGDLEAIPGGPADQKNRDKEKKVEAGQDASIAQAERIINTIDSAMKKVSAFSAGMGSTLSDVPATSARDLKADLETIKANLGFAELQAMRQSSPSGSSGLGALAQQELNALQATVTSLDQGQSAQQLKANLEKAKGHYQKWQQLMLQAKNESGGDGGGAGGADGATIDIIDSEGQKHTILAKNLEAAKKRDPGVKVAQ